MTIQRVVHGRYKQCESNVPWNNSTKLPATSVHVNKEPELLLTGSRPNEKGWKGKTHAHKWLSYGSDVLLSP
jgi:hypothetical protein